MKHEIYSQVAGDISLPVSVVEKVYNSFWLFIKTKIKELPFDRVVPEQEFQTLRTSFNIPALGKISCDYKRYQGIVKKKKFLIENHNGTDN